MKRVLKRHKVAWAELCLYALNAGGVSALAAQPTAASPPTVKVAVIDSFTGKNGNFGQAALANVAFAVGGVNAVGGIKTAMGSRSIVLLHYDAKEKRSAALDALRTAIADGHRLIFQGAEPGTGAALVQIVDGYNSRHPGDPVQLLSYRPVAPPVPGSQCSKSNINFFGDVPSRVAAMLANLYADAGVRRIALLGENSRYGQAVLKEIKLQLASQRPDIEVVADLLYTTGMDESLERFVLLAKSKGAQAIATGSDGGQLEGMMGDAAKVGFVGAMYTAGAAPQTVPTGLRGRVKGVSIWDEHASGQEERAVASQFALRTAANGNARFMPEIHAAVDASISLLEGRNIDRIKFGKAVQECAK